MCVQLPILWYCTLSFFYINTHYLVFFAFQIYQFLSIAVFCGSLYLCRRIYIPTGFLRDKVFISIKDEQVFKDISNHSIKHL